MKTISNMEQLKIMLNEKGLKPTYQRLRILEYMSNHEKCHPTAEMIYEALAPEIPTISVTTIYNTLNAFLEKGLVSAETITGKEIRYDLLTSPHHHFLCNKCGAIIDLDIRCPFVDREIESIDGHKIIAVHGYFRGICKKCLAGLKETEDIIKR
jgi:Fe2+ or Zn2+ uptake regulation protein